MAGSERAFRHAVERYVEVHVGNNRPKDVIPATGRNGLSRAAWRVMDDDPCAEKPLRLTGRSSSHFTRVVRMFAHELGVPLELAVARDLTSLDAAAYGGHPALKVPTLHTAEGSVFGTDNICRTLAELAGRAHDPRVVLSEQVDSTLVRNGQELIWNSMAAQVQLRLSALGAALPAEALLLAKAKAGMTGALAWLDERCEQLLALLPDPRDVSVFEISLFCLIRHLEFCQTVQFNVFPRLRDFANTFGERDSARSTPFHFDSIAEPPQLEAGVP
jgi:glutathione S-transferase